MNTRYFFSAEEAAEQLGLPLLLATSPFPGVPRIGLRLSEQAPDPILGARIYHRLDVSAEAINLVIWVASPWETSEHLAWAIALAEQAARAGRVAYLVDLDRASTLRPLTRGPGRPVPASLEKRLSAWGIVGAAAWASDLQGVRIVLPTDQSPKGDRLEEGEWTVLLAGALPDEREDLTRIGSDADRVVLATGFRDHPIEELKAAVETLREAGALLVGLVAMGPISRRGRSALDREQPVGESPLKSKREAAKRPEVPPVRPVRTEVAKPETGERVEARDSRPPTPVREGRVESMLPLPGTKVRGTVPEPPEPVSEPEPRQEPRPEPAPKPEQEAPLEPEQKLEREPDAEPESSVTEPTPEAVERKPESPPATIEQEPVRTEPVEPPEPVPVPEPRQEPTPEVEVAPAPVYQETSAPTEEKAYESPAPVGEDAAFESRPAPLEMEPEENRPQGAAETPAAEQDRSAQDPGTVDLFAAWNRRRQPARVRPRLLTGAILVAVLAGIVWLSDSFGLLPFKILVPSSSDLEVGSEQPPPAAEPVETGRGGELWESALISPSDSILQGDDLALTEIPLRDEENEDEADPSQEEALPDGETAKSMPDAVTTPPEAEPTVGRSDPEKVPEPVRETAPVEQAEPEPAIVERTVRWEHAFVVHVSSFRGAVDADAAAARLKNAGLPARVVTVVLPDRGRWERVVVGAYPDSQAAGRVAQRLRAEGLVSFAQILGNGGAGNARYIGQR